MKRFDEWFFPDNEEHLQGWMTQTNDRQHGRLAYQGQKYRHACKHSSHRRVAIDVGAHIGLWSYFMAKDYERVIAFEPMPEHVECWKANMQGIKNAQLVECALGDSNGMVELETKNKGSSGDTRIVALHAEENGIPIYCLDDILPQYKPDAVDLIKVDCEGYELPVLLGARQTLLTYKPFIVVEQKPNNAQNFGFKETEALDFLLELGAKQFSADGGDYFFKWD